MSTTKAKADSNLLTLSWPAVRICMFNVLSHNALSPLELQRVQLITLRLDVNEHTARIKKNGRFHEGKFITISFSSANAIHSSWCLFKTLTSLLTTH